MKWFTRAIHRYWSSWCLGFTLTVSYPIQIAEKSVVVWNIIHCWEVRVDDFEYNQDDKLITVLR